MVEDIALDNIAGNGDASVAAASTGRFLKINRFISWLKRRRSKLVVGTLVVAIIVAIVVGVICGSSNNDTSKSVSFHQNISTNFTDVLDYTIDPCQDFYQFTCKKTRNKFRAVNLTDSGTLDEMHRQAWISLGEFLLLPLNNSDAKMLSDFKSFYQRCTTEDHRFAEETTELRQMLEDLGGWAVISNQEKNLKVIDEKWESVIGKINRGGFLSLFPFNLHVDFHTDDDTKLSVRLYPYLFDRKQFPSESNLTTTYVTSIASLLFSHESDNIVNINFEDCVTFEEKLYNITISEKVNFTSCTVNDLSTCFPEFNWNIFFNGVFANSGVNLSGNDMIVFPYPGYISKVTALLKNTTVETVRNYLVFQILDEAISILPFDSQFRVAQREYQQGNSQYPRKVECLHVLMTKVAPLMGQIYVERFFPSDVKFEVENMYKSVKKGTLAYLQKVDWISGQAKEQVIDNLSRLKMTLGYVDGYRSMDIFSLNSTVRRKGTIISQYRDLSKLERVLTLKKFRISRGDFESFIALQHATQTNAMYVLGSDRTHIFAAIVQKPLFDLKQPTSLNYGGAGFAIGHELTHALRILSSCSDVSFCPSFKQFQEYEKCLMDEYSSYFINQINETVDGNRTLEENLGDLIGTKVVYDAYDQWLQMNEDISLPNLNFTSRQLFWIGVAMTHCSYQSNEVLKGFVEKDQHSPDEVRINLVFRNLPEFARDYKCPLNSPMNPAKKCLSAAERKFEDV